MVKHISQFTNFVNSTIDNGRLLFVEKIGSGSYGEVYKALDVTSPMDNPAFYAVKCIHKPPLTSRRAMYLAREISLHKSMSQHPHIVSLRNVIEEHDFVFLVMDYCPGGDMFAAISEKNVYANNDALLKATFIDIIDAVDYCHEHNVFHRDLKPENILCGADGSHILLTDFGMATSDRISKEFNDGSGIYMSPECLCKTDVGYMPLQSDIWALGVILIVMITRHLPPWKQASLKDKGFCHFLKKPRILGRVFHISESASAILQQIFRLDPLSRISLNELRREILKVDSFTKRPGDMTLRVPIRRFIPRIPRYRRKDDVKEKKHSIPCIFAPTLFSSTSHIPNVQGNVGPVKNLPSLSAPCGSKSSGESDGPITPETHPAPDVGIADLDVEALDLNPKSSIQKPTVSPNVIPRPPRRKVYKGTVERVQALPQFV